MPPKRKVNGMPAMKTPASKKKYETAPTLPAGESLVDYNKKEWLLGHCFATGGFGRIHYAKSASDSTKKENFVIKMEPAENGPLFTEFHMYGRIGKAEVIEEFRKQHGIKFLGVPTFFGCGLHVKKFLTYRFLVLPRLGQDVEKLRESQPAGRFENAPDVGRLALTCIDVFSYLHAQRTVHADLKGENMLFSMDCTPEPKNLHKVYLVDYGLARRVPEHVVYKEAPKKAHDGTLIFTSLDAHRGCSPIYRDDVEILAYNLMFWLLGTLPWIDQLAEQVFRQKLQLSTSTGQRLTAAFCGQRLKNSPLLVKFLTKFFDVCYSTEYDDKPDYAKLRAIVEDLIEQGEKSKKSPDKSNFDDENSTKNKRVVRTLRKMAPNDSEAKNNYVRADVPEKSLKKAGSTKNSRPANQHPAVESTSTTSKISTNQPPAHEATIFKMPNPRTFKKQPVAAGAHPSSPRLQPSASMLSSENDSDDDIFAPKRVKVKRALKKLGRELLEDETEDATTTADDEFEAPNFEAPAVIAKKHGAKVQRIPGIANLQSHQNAKLLNVPKAAFRRRQSIEASLVNKYRKLLPAKKGSKIVEKIPETFDESLSSDVEEKNDATKIRRRVPPPSLRLYNAETQTSPDAFENWMATRGSRRRGML